MIVSFSGIDSAGKTTQIELLYKYCQENGIKIRKVWSKARGTPGVLFLKELVRKDKKMNSEDKKEYRKEVYKSPKKKKLLLTASLLDLLWFWGIYYRILNIRYKMVLCDRYIWDTLVEVKSDFKGIDVEKMFLWKCVKVVAPKPKHSFLFVIPPKVSIERDIQKSAAGIEDLDVKRKKIDTYFELKEQNKWKYVIDGMRPIDEIFDEIKSILGV